MRGAPLQHRALGALAGVAVGDAMGMPTQTLSRPDIKRIYGVIDGFRDAAPGQPVSAGLKAGTVTDDTEQSLLLAHHLIARHGKVDQDVWAAELLAWERETHARGVNDLLGPSTRRAIEALQRGVPVSEAGRSGTTNGAAMRIVPVAIAMPLDPLGSFIDAVEDSCRLTHNTAEAIGTAAAVAAAVSAAIEGADLDGMITMALAAAGAGEGRGQAPRSGSARERIAVALALADEAGGEDAVPELADRIGTSVAALQSIPMAFALLRLTGADPWRCAVLSAGIGDDTDTIGAIACGMAGARAGFEGIPTHAWALVSEVNHLALDETVAALLDLRVAPRGTKP